MVRNKVIAIDIGSRNLHVIEGRVRSGVIEIKKQGVFPIPPNCVSNGQIEDSEIMKVSIRNALSHSRIRARNAVITVQSTSVLIKEFEIPVAASKELRNMVQYEMEQFIPADGSNYVFEFRILGEVVEDNIRKHRIRAAAMPETMADGYYSMLKQLRLKPVALDINSNCTPKFFEGQLEVNDKVIDENQNIALIDIGYTSTSIYVYSNKSIDFSRFVPIGTKDIDLSIASYFNISIEKAEKKKIEQLDINTEYFLGDSSENMVKVKDVLSEFQYNWTGEIQKVQQYFESRDDLSRINGIFIFGGGANIKGMPMYLENIFNIPVSKIEKVKKLKFKSYTGSLSCEFYFNAAGCIIRY